MRHVSFATAAATTLLCVLATPSAVGAQERALEGHAVYARSTQTHQNSWGVGAQYGLTFGSEGSPQLNTSAGVDYQKQESGGQQQLSGSIDAALQISLGPSVSPYAGGSISINRLSGGTLPSSVTEPGFQYIVGTQVKLDPQGPLALRVDVRPGYVRTQEHSVSWRFGVSYSL